MCTWARLVDNHGGGLYVFNTHWDHANQQSRVAASKLLIKQIQARSYIDEPVILLGDFNADLNNPAIKTLLKAKGLRGLELQDIYAQQYPKAANPNTLSHWKTKVDGSGKIDHAHHCVH